MELREAKLEGIDQFVLDLVAVKKSVGFSIGIRTETSKIFAKSYGTLEVNETQECNNQTLFCVGSLSKSFTTLSIQILAERGKLHIDDPISKYIPLELKGKEHKIKLKHLMSHSSGFPNIYLCVMVEKNLGERPDYNGLDMSRKLDSWDDLFRYINQHAEFITSSPGERFHYSDTGFSLLQYVIEQVSGLSYGDFVREHIFNPLEMNIATVRSKFEDNGNATYGHLGDRQTKGNGIIRTYQNYPISELVDGGGGIMTNNDGLQNYLSMMMNKGVFRDKRLISAESYNALITPFVTINKGRGTSYCFGWMLMQNGDHKFIFHTGNTGASTTQFGFLVDDNLGMFILNNINQFPIPIYISILQLVSGGSFSLPYNDLLFRMEHDYVGKYVGLGGIENIEISSTDGDLIIDMIPVDVNGIWDNFRKPLRKLGDQLYLIEGTRTTEVYLETIDYQQWLTIGVNKYKKIS